MRIRIPSGISRGDAVALQERLAPLVKEISEFPSRIRSLVGCDATYFQGQTIAAAIRVDYEDLGLQGTRLVQELTGFPYIPGLLAFREGPSVLKAIRSLKARSYVCLVDAHGVAHPRRFGLACFVGLALNRSTIGVAKSLLFGRVEGNQVLGKDNYPIAEIVTLPRTRKKIYVSVGHKISLRDAVEIVKHCCTQKGPVPINLAHEEVTKQRWMLQRSNPTS